MEKQLDGKVAIVTGAGRGCGATIARTLAVAGVFVAVNDINPDRAERVAADIRAAGGQAVGIMADVSNKFQCSHLIETTRAAWGKLDILVNNASVQPNSSILKMDEWDWDRCLDVNLKGTFLMSQLCGRVMADENGERGGVIVNLSSVAGVEAPLEHQAAHCAAAAGIVGFTRECAREYGQHGIRVHAVLKSQLAADHPDQDRQKGPGEIDREWQEQSLEMAHAVLRLCAEAMQNTGETLPAAW